MKKIELFLFCKFKKKITLISKWILANDSFSKIKNLDISFDASNHFLEVTIFIEGFGECEWQERRETRNANGENRVEWDYFRGHDQYLNNETRIVPIETGKLL